VERCYSGQHDTFLGKLSLNLRGTGNSPVNRAVERRSTMSGLFNIFAGDNAATMASVVAFVSFFLIGRVAHARQSVAFAFAFTPLIAFFAIEFAALALL